VPAKLVEVLLLQVVRSGVVYSLATVTLRSN
jgi:hypothetical protein